MRLARLGLCLASLAYCQDELRRAAQLDGERKCEEAQILYDGALAKHPASAPLLNNLGNHYLVCGQSAKAQAVFERLVRLQPDHMNANVQLARIAADRKQGAKSLQYLSRIKDQNPAIRLLRGEAMYYAGDGPGALAILDGVEKESQADLRLLFALGLTCSRIGLYDRAERLFESVLVARPDDSEIIFQLGRAAARAQHYTRAQRALETAAKLRPGDPESLLELGLVYAALQDFSRSVYVLAQARRLAPERPDVLLALARASEDAGYYGDSALAYDEYLRIRPADDAVRRDRGRVCGYTSTRAKEGMQELRDYVAGHPEDPVGHYYLAQLTWSSNSELALEQLSTALRLNPKFAAAHFSRGWLLYRAGRTLEALADLQTTARLEPQNIRALDQLGLAYLSLDKLAEAEKVLRRAESLAPEDAEVAMHLGRTLIAADRPKEAQPYLEKFRKLKPERGRTPLQEPGMIELATMSNAERTKRQIERLRRDSEDHPGDPELALGLAELLLRNGQTSQAESNYRKLLQIQPDARSAYRAGKSLSLAGEYGLAIEFLERAADLPDARLDLAIALLAAGSPQRAIGAMEGIAEAARGGDYYLLKARILGATGQITESEQALQHGLRLSFTRADVAQRMASWLVQQNRTAEALDVVSRAVKNNPSDPDLWLTNAIVLALTRRHDDALKMVKRIETRWPEWDRVYLAHGLMLAEINRAEDARRILNIAAALGTERPAKLRDLLFQSGQ
jgi:tetratricopeptide (TPR) repeat protein